MRGLLFQPGEVHCRRQIQFKARASFLNVFKFGSQGCDGHVVLLHGAGEGVRCFPLIRSYRRRDLCSSLRLQPGGLRRESVRRIAARGVELGGSMCGERPDRCLMRRSSLSTDRLDVKRERLLKLGSPGLGSVEIDPHRRECCRVLLSDVSRRSRGSRQFFQRHVALSA